MTVKELKQKIENLPDTMDVMVEQSNDESRYGMSNEAVVEPVLFGDDDLPIDEWPSIDCLIIRD